MKNKRIFRAALSFDKASLQIGATGVSMPKPKNYAEYRSQFESAKDYLQFGLFGNEPQFYSGVEDDDIVPKPEDYVEVPFRLISATIVGGGTWKATDFSNASILQQSRNMLEGKGVFKDHETDVNNWCGIIKAVKWTESFVNPDGVRVPAGIDGILAIDKKVEPKLARGLLAGAIYSNSVTVEFEWVMSHEFATEDEFLMKLGSVAADGKMVRRVVTNILNYHETSLVWLGADPFAKAIQTDGGLRNIDVSSVVAYGKKKLGDDCVSFDKEPEAAKKFYTNSKNYEINFGVDENVLSLAKNNYVPQINIQMDKNLQTILTAFVAAFGTSLNLTKPIEQLKADEVVEGLKKLTFMQEEDKNRIKLATDVENTALAFLKEIDPATETVNMEAFLKDHSFVGNSQLTAYKEDAKAVADFKTTFEVKDGEAIADVLAAAKVNADQGIAALNAKRDEAVRLYKITVGEDKADPKVIETYQKADSATVDGLLKQYTKGATGKFTATCKGCGSHEVSFQSSSLPEEGGETKVAVKPLSNADIYAEAAQTSMFGNSNNK